MLKAFIIIPVELWSGFRDRVMTTWFSGSPLFIRHCEPILDGWEFATFIVDNPSDIDVVFKMIPVGGMGITIDLFTDIT